jgi:hypothetical protein
VGDWRACDYARFEKRRTVERPDDLRMRDRGGAMVPSRGETRGPELKFNRVLQKYVSCLYTHINSTNGSVNPHC